MAAKLQLKIVGAQVRRPPQLAKADVASAAVGGAQERHVDVSVQVENPGKDPLYVWKSLRAYEYDAATHVLTIYLTEHIPPPPPGFKMLSDHPRTPIQVEVGSKSGATVDVQVPALIRRRVPGTGLGMSFVEEPIGRVDRVDLHVQHADTPLTGEFNKGDPADNRKRMLAHGEVVRASIVLTGETER